MSTENLEQFMSKVADSEELQAKIGEEIDAEELIALGAECGCEFTAEELQRLVIGRSISWVAMRYVTYAQSYTMKWRLCVSSWDISSQLRDGTHPLLVGDHNTQRIDT